MIQEIIDFEIKPLKNRVEQLEINRNRLMEKVDNLEQYGRRSLLRVSGIPESVGENTDLIVRSLFKEIDPAFNDLNVERTHRMALCHRLLQIHLQTMLYKVPKHQLNSSPRKRNKHMITATRDLRNNHDKSWYGL